MGQQNLEKLLEAKTGQWKNSLGLTTHKEEAWVDQDFAMEVYPALRIDSKLSTRRNIVCELMNEEVIDIFVQFS